MAYRHLSVFFFLSIIITFFSACNFGEDGIRHGKIIVNGHTIKNAHAGSIKRIFVREGDYINKGDTLMTINVQSQPLQQDPAVLKQKKDIAYATLMRCQQDYEICRQMFVKVERLYADELMPISQYDKALIEYKTMEAQLKAARTQYELLCETPMSRVIVSDISGEVSDVYVQEKVAIPANTDLLCVYVADDVWGQFDVKESDTLRFSKGDTIDVEVTAFDRTMPMLVCGFADSDTLKTSSDDIGKQLRMFVKPTAESEILRQGMQLVIP